MRSSQYSSQSIVLLYVNLVTNSSRCANFIGLAAACATGAHILILRVLRVQPPPLPYLYEPFRGPFGFFKRPPQVLPNTFFPSPATLHCSLRPAPCRREALHHHNTLCVWSLYMWLSPQPLSSSPWGGKSGTTRAVVGNNIRSSNHPCHHPSFPPRSPPCCAPGPTAY